MNRVICRRALGLVLVFGACGSATAATLRQLSMDQMTQSATAIVRARVTGSSASFTGSTIYTHYKLQVSEVWKGAGATEVMLPGGIANGYRQSFPGVPGLQVGSEYILFLWKSPSTGITHLEGFGQGLYNVVTQTDGSVQANRPPIGEGMLDVKGRVVKGQAIQMQLDDMKARIKTSAAGAGK
jgi:hypothetical protein